METNENEMVMLVIKTTGNNFSIPMPRSVVKSTIQKLHDAIANLGENPRIKYLEWESGTRIYPMAIQGWMITKYEDPQKAALEKARFEQKTLEYLRRSVEGAEKAVGDISEGDEWKNQ